LYHWLHGCCWNLELQLLMLLLLVLLLPCEVVEIRNAFVVSSFVIYF
jgi:hypothetical protein